MLKNRIARTSVFALFVIVVPAIGAVAGTSAPGVPASPGPQVHLLELPGVRRLFDTLERERRSGSDAEQEAALAEFSLLAEAVVGDPLLVRSALEDFRGIATTLGPLVQVTSDLTLRDRAAYQLQALGYSAREAADVVSGRISLAALDTARKMLMVGRGSEAAANYLDSQYKRVVAAREWGAADLAARHPQNPIEAAIEKYASLYGVDPAIIRAIIAVESAYNVEARSRAGAIGLMQLMPATARSLGVNNPWDPAQNIRGGTDYLRQLLDEYEGNEELALAAYNAGSGAVAKYGRRVPPYRETRDYVRKVGAAAGDSESGPRRKLIIYKTIEILDGRAVPRYSSERPSSGTFQIVSR